MESNYIPLEQAAELENTKYKAYWMRIKRSPSNYDIKTESSDISGRPRVLVSTSSLSPEGKKRYLQQKLKQHREAAEKLLPPEPQKEKQHINFASLEIFVGRERYSELIKDADKAYYMVKKYLELCNRLESKTEAATVVADANGVSVASVYRYIQRYNEGGYDALIRLPIKFKEKRGVIRTSVPEDLRKVIRQEYLQPHKPKASHVYKKITTYCKLMNITAPSRASVGRFIADMKKSEPDLVCLARDGTEQYNKDFMVKAVREIPKYANQIWEGDHHRLDAFISYKGKPVRPWLTIWYDPATGTVRGYTIAIQANGETINLAFRHGALKKQLPQFKTSEVSDVLLRTVARLGWLPDELESLSGWETPVYGLPREIYIDNGKDYQASFKKGLKHSGWDYSEQIQTLSKSLNFETTYCTPYSPWAKGHCERFFGTLTDQFSRYLPGYCGSDNKSRPAGLNEKKMAEKGELLTLDEVYMLLEFKIHFYHSDENSSLGMSPYQKVEETPLARTDMPDERTLDLCLMDAATAKVQTSGIERFGSRGKPRWYYNDLLTPYVKTEVVVRWDPSRIGELLVFEPGVGGKYICTAINREALKFGLAQEDIKELRQKQARRRKELKSRLNEDKSISVEAVILERTKGGNSVVSGETKSTKTNVATFTGLEKAAKATSKKQNSFTENLDNFKKAANDSGPTSIFDEYLIKKGMGLV